MQDHNRINILFMCVANSARSQLAHGLASTIFQSHAVINSAGSKPTSVNPYAIKVLKQKGIDISNHQSKTVSDLDNQFLSNLDYVITLCGEQVCPVLTSTKAKKLYWPFADPANKGDSQEEKLAIFRVTRDKIEQKIMEFYKSLGLQTQKI